MADSPAFVPASNPAPPDAPRQPGAWLAALGLSALLLCILAWLLARLIWLPFLFGLFFYLIAALLAGAISFRVGRPARPVKKTSIVRGVIGVGLLCVVVSVVFEYRYFIATVGEPPKFPEARNAVIAEGRSSREIDALAADSFRAMLARDYRPGGVLGYIRWSIQNGEGQLSVRGFTDKANTQHRGWLWPVRTLLAWVLTSAGLWSSLESLRSITPVSNLIQPGEEMLEET